MAQQGGKGKQSSQSDKNYWSRLKAADGMTKRKAARVAKSTKSAAGIDYSKGKTPKGKPAESVVFSGTSSENFPKWNIPPVFVISDGVTLGVYPREMDALNHFNDRRPGTFARVATGEKIPRILALSLPVA